MKTVQWERLVEQLGIGLLVAILVGGLGPYSIQVARQQWEQFVQWQQLPPPITAPLPENVTPSMTVQEVHVQRHVAGDILSITVQDIHGVQHTLAPIRISSHGTPLGQIRGTVQRWLNTR